MIPSDEYLDLGWAIGDVLDTLEQLQAENEKLKAQVPRWIPVEERLPDNSDNQVVITDGEKRMVEYRNHLFGLQGKQGVFAPHPKTAGGYMQVTHWMPLPAVPKEEKKDD